MSQMCQSHLCTYDCVKCGASGLVCTRGGGDGQMKDKGNEIKDLLLLVIQLCFETPWCKWPESGE